VRRRKFREGRAYKIGLKCSLCVCICPIPDRDGVLDFLWQSAGNQSCSAAEPYVSHVYAPSIPHWNHPKKWFALHLTLYQLGVEYKNKHIWDMIHRQSFWKDNQITAGLAVTCVWMRPPSKVRPFFNQSLADDLTTV